MAKIIIDAGHGGVDGGAQGNGIVEKDLTLKISQYMYDLFKNLGVPVTMTRSSDETVSPSERVERVLSPYGNSSDVIVISNHINAGGGDGAEVIYALRNNGELANLVLDGLANAGQNPRKAYQRRLPSDPSKDYYFMHRNTGITEPIIVEYGFLDSNGDDVNLLKNNWQQLTEAVVKAVASYIGVNYEQELPGYYIVKSGDTLYSIAKKFNTTVDELRRLNNLSSNTLSVGEQLKIPEKVETEETEGTYIVKSGDTLYSIANRFNTTVDELKKLNNLVSDILSVGQQLIIKEPEIDITPTGLYIVKSGDTLYSIAKKFNTTVDELKRLNNLTTNMLSIGDKLKIPETMIEEPETKDYIIYTVKKGDNLYNLAREYNTTVTEIMNLNGLTTNLLSINQELKIPINSSNQTTYTVKSGDTLYSIANKLGITVNELKKLNNLTTDLLSIGQVLKIK